MIFIEPGNGKNTSKIPHTATLFWASKRLWSIIKSFGRIPAPDNTTAPATSTAFGQKNICTPIYSSMQRLTRTVSLW